MFERKASIFFFFLKKNVFYFVEKAIFNNMQESENKYLHEINLEELKKETGLSHEEIAELASVGPKVVYKWQYMHKDSSRPDYNTLIRLLEKGATVETLFGVDYKNKFKPNEYDTECNEIFKSDSFKRGVEKAIQELKNKGLL